MENKLFLPSLYRVKLIKSMKLQVDKELENNEDVYYYLNNWREKTSYNVEEYDDDYQQHYQSKRYKFEVIKNNGGTVFFEQTVHQIQDDDILLRIAIDLGVDTPYFIPTISHIKNVIKEEINQSNILHDFERAMKDVHERPDDSVKASHRILTGVCAFINHKLNLPAEGDDNKTVEQTLNAVHISRKTIKQLLENNNDNTYQNYKEYYDALSKIGSGCQTIADNIGTLRDKYAKSHKALDHHYVIDDANIAYFAINVCSSLSWFLWALYMQNNKPDDSNNNIDNHDSHIVTDVSNDDIPF